MLSFACPTNELKDYSSKPLKQKYVSKTVKEKRIFEGKSAAANLAALIHA